MDPAKCLEILGSRGTCSGSHGAYHGHADPTPSQAAAEEAATAAGGGGQVINLATGSNETIAATEAATSLMSTMALDGSAARPSAAAPCAESPERGDGNGGGSGDAHTSSADGQRGNRDTQAGGAEDGTGAASGSGGGGCCASAGDGAQELAPAKSASAAADAAGKDDVLKGLEGMSGGALVASFRRAQEERVALYRKFNGGLKEALRGGDYSGYPALCCEVTAGFSVLSKAINAIEDLLGGRDETKPVAAIIRRVQEHEREKLTVTAAHHLESMREARALGMGPGMTPHAGAGGDTEPSSPAQERLLKDGVGDLSRRAEAAAAAVTELLEELRYEAEGLE
eukprot:g10428.t1